MDFLLLLIILSWLAIFFAEKKNIVREWLMPVHRRARELIFGFVLTAILCVITQQFLALFSDVQWSLSPEISYNKILASIKYDIRSVLIEELLFRGAVLYFLIKYLKANIAIIISAIAFGVYHWFTFGVLGNVTAMAIVLLTTGWMGFAFAVAFGKTRSLILPVALHLGWNIINNTVYSNGPNGIQILVPEKSVEMTGTYSLVALIVYLIIPALVLAFVKSKIIKKSYFEN